MASVVLALSMLFAAPFGSLEHALNVAATCETPTSWAQPDPQNPGWWYAVCGTADGRVCGQDVPWTHHDCQESQHHNACDQY